MMAVGKKNLFLVIAFFITSAASGQWVTQNIPLSPGWNAVYLEVEPEPRDADIVFEGMSIESVWMWARRFSTFEFSADSLTPLPSDPHWLQWLPSSHPQSYLDNLRIVTGGCAYLIKVDDVASPFVWSVKGRPILSRIDWLPKTQNLVGFSINPVSLPNFNAFFSFTDAIEVFLQSGGEIHKIKPDGSGDLVRVPTLEAVERGKAYWVKSNKQSDYVGPLSVRLDAGDILDFDGDTVERDLTIKNETPSNTVTITITQIPSETPPSGAAVPELAGDVALSYYEIDLASSNQFGWIEWPSALMRDLDPQEEWNLKLSLRRSDMPDYTPTGTNGALYQSLLVITESENMVRHIVPVTAEK